MLELGRIPQIPALEKLPPVESEGLGRGAFSDPPIEFDRIDHERFGGAQALSFADDPVVPELLAQQIQGLVEGMSGPFGGKVTPDRTLQNIPGDVPLHCQIHEDCGPGGLFGESGQLFFAPKDPKSSQRLDTEFHGRARVRISTPSYECVDQKPMLLQENPPTSTGQNSLPARSRHVSSHSQSR